jgi:hypothetical protein
MEASTEAVEPRIEAPARTAIDGPGQGRLAGFIERYRFAILAYLGTRVLLLVVAVIDGWIHTRSFTHEIGNWDGFWYHLLAENGYPHHVPTVHGPAGQTTLGFFPLFSIAIWAVRPIFFGSAVTAGFGISMVGGLIATVLVQRLAAGWWDEQSGRRAALLFCVFPGSIVFSMTYSEGLLLPLAAGCLLALQERRWLLAGLSAGFATAVEPDALVLVLVCGVAALLELRRLGWRSWEARRSLIAPVLSVTGVGAFAVFLWSWTGTPLATFKSQHNGWGEKTDPFALVHDLTRFLHQISLSHFNQPTINLNYPVGLIGAVILVAGIVMLCRQRGRVPLTVVVWTVGIAFLAMTSEYVPPNPRLLITAFPAIVVYVRYLNDRWFKYVMAAMFVLLVELSALTYVGVTLRP